MSSTTRHGDRSPLLPSRSSAVSWKSPAGPNQHLCLRSLAGRSVFSGTVWSILPISAPSWRFSMPMLLCRCWWNSVRRSGTLRKISWTLLALHQQRAAEQLATIPVPRGRGGHRLQGLLPGQVSTASLGPDHADEHVPDSSEGVQLSDAATGKPCHWNRRTHATVWQPPRGVRVVWVCTQASGGRVYKFDLTPLLPQ